MVDYAIAVISRSCRCEHWSEFEDSQSSLEGSHEVCSISDWMRASDVARLLQPRRLLTLDTPRHRNNQHLKIILSFSRLFSLPFPRCYRLRISQWQSILKHILERP